MDYKLKNTSNARAILETFKISAAESDKSYLKKYIKVEKQFNPSVWLEIANEKPFKYKCIVPFECTDNALVELVNNQPVLFADYGFCIAEAASNQLVLYALKKPETSVSLTFFILEDIWQ